MRDSDAIIVGAGLTGLSAAVGLSRAGLSVLVFEKHGYIGGRMSTESLDGYKLDRGFQVILSGHPEVRKLSGFSSLRCQSFSSGARIRFGGKFIDLLDPRRHPEALFSTLLSPLASTGDLWRFYRLTRCGRDARCAGDGEATDRALAQYRFSKPFQNGLLRPFLRSFLLDPLLQGDFAIARSYLQAFVFGDALLPRGGIQALPNLLAEQVGASHIRLNSSVNAVTKNEVVLDNGETFSADHVVCAVDSLGASQLGASEQTFQYHSGATLYFGAPEPPFREPIIVLNADGGPITTLAVLTNVESSYAPPGKNLIAISVIGNEAFLEESKLVEQVTRQAREWYGDSVGGWRYLKTFAIPAATVARPRLGSGWTEQAGVFYAGDYLSDGSQNGALAAGFAVAEHIVDILIGYGARTPLIRQLATQAPDSSLGY